MSASEGKYVNRKDKIVHCPKCRGVVLKHFQTENSCKKMSMFLKCPHCQEGLRVLFENSSVMVEKLEQK